MRPVPEVSDLEMAFGASNILPPMSEIPPQFKPVGSSSCGGVRHYSCRDKDGNKVEPATKWLNVVSDWFFRGISEAVWTPKAGVDTNKALRAVQACLGSWEPSHEHKEAGCAMLLAEWFDDVTYKAAK